MPAVPGDGGDVLHHQLPRLRLAGPALPGEDDGLVLALVAQQVPGSVSQGVTEEKYQLGNWSPWSLILTCEGAAG